MTSNKEEAASSADDPNLDGEKGAYATSNSTQEEKDDLIIVFCFIWKE